MDAGSQEEGGLCWNCLGKGHFKRNCTSIVSYYCGGEHMKNHCIKYSLELKYQPVIQKRDRRKYQKDLLLVDNANRFKLNCLGRNKEKSDIEEPPSIVKEKIRQMESRSM